MYKSYLNYFDNVEAINVATDHFQKLLARKLNLIKVPAPLVLVTGTGINDYQTGQIPIVFDVPDVNKKAEIVRSLAKWKRLTLTDYKFPVGFGLYTDMRAVRQDETLDSTHSLFVDQWDWEKVIRSADRNVVYLKKTVRQIYAIVRQTEKHIFREYPQLPAPLLPKKIYCIYTEDLNKLYPSLTPKEREDAICKEKKAVFLIGIGSRLNESRSVDHDDWSTESQKGKIGLNGDILVWHPILKSSLEICSLGIRTNSDSLIKQLKKKGDLDRAKLYYHKRVLTGDICQTIGGGIGQSRLNMFFLKKAHIGEVQVGVWSMSTKEHLKHKNINIL